MNWPLVVTGILTGTITANEVAAGVRSQNERRKIYEKASDYCIKVRKPLLVIGTPNAKHPGGDNTIDISPQVLEECPVGGMVMDVYNIDSYFPSKCYAASVFMHVLEHLEDPELALRKALRISDRVYFAGPASNSVFTRVNPKHISIRWWFDFKKRMKCPSCGMAVPFVAEVIPCESCNNTVKMFFG